MSLCQWSSLKKGTVISPIQIEESTNIQSMHRSVELIIGRTALKGMQKFSDKMYFDIIVNRQNKIYIEKWTVIKFVKCIIILDFQPPSWEKVWQK